MRTRINHNLNRLLSICIILALLLSTIGSHGTMVYAAETSFDTATLSLNSNTVDDESVDLYVKDSVHYILIEDLCELVRCSWTEKDDVIWITQGFWSTTFDVKNQVFDDGYQTVKITILEVSSNKYAVPALMFLNYFKAAAFIENDTLYCEMPEFTAWEALNVDYANTLVDIYELYGGEGNVTLSLTLDIIMDFIMGDMSTSEDYLSDAFLTALKVDLYNYDSVQKYKETSQGKLYSFLHSDKGEEFVEAVDDVLSVSAEPTQWYIQYYYNAIEKSFVSLAYDAFEAGQHADVTHYGEKFYEAFTEKNKTSETAEKYFDNADYVMLFVSAAVDTAQQMKYTNATDNLIYNVMGQDNLNYLGITPSEDNGWFTVANRYRNVLGVAATQLEAEAMQLFTDKLCWETLIGTGVSSAAGISGGAWTFSLNFARLFVEKFPLTSSSVEAFKADRRALYLSELQQNVYWVALNTLQDMQGQWDNPEIYTKYIQALQLYCRTSIAMYENLITMVDEFGKNRDYWTSLFQNRIDMLAVSLYQLTILQDDGVNKCLPLELSSFNIDNSTDVSISAYLPFVEKAIAETAYDSATGSGFLYDMDNDGGDELVILNTYAEVGGNSFPGHAYSVYDIENGEVITKCDKELLFYDAGGPSGYVGVVNYLGDTAFVVYIDNGETGYQAHRETLHTIYNPDDYQVITTTTLDYVSSDPVQANSCSVNGKSCSYNDYLSIIDAIEPIVIAEIYSNNESDGSMGLYELLRFIQTTSGITAEQAPQITKADAEKIANSVWSKYLKREQGFDWKIFEEESLIKKGVEYYCYTLQTNSKYGATDWSIFYYLFINSVTGEHSYSLYDSSDLVNITVPAETERAKSTQTINTNTITEEELLGKWSVDTEYTMEYNEMSMNDMFGRPYSDSMIFGEQGYFKYYITYYGGSGQYQILDDQISYSIVTDYDQEESGEIQIQKINDTLYLVQKVIGYTVFWRKS